MKVTQQYTKKTMELGDLERFVATAKAAGCTSAAHINVVEGFKVRTLEAEMKD